MSAAAVLASTGAATAGTHSFVFSGYCDGGTVTTGLANQADAWIHTNNNCASGTSQGSGVLGKIKALGKAYMNSDNYLAKNDGIYTEYLSYSLPKKIANGGQWTVWLGFSGVSNFESNSGTLGSVTAGAHGVKSHGTVSTAAKVGALIAAHRQ